jgi:uncharacterized protein YutE (UPF0331/DUF86 family)
MADQPPRKAEVNRWRRSITDHLEDFPRQYAALETAMAAFGDDFDRRQFTRAFNTSDDLEAYNRVQAVERALGRVQNYVAALAEAAVKLAALPRPPLAANGSRAQQAFEALREAGVIDARLCRRLTRAQRARSNIEHGYVRAGAGDVHAAAHFVHDGARDFIAAYRRWIEAHLTGEPRRG